MDTKFIVTQCFTTLYEKEPSIDSEFSGVRVYLNECKATLNELQRYNVNLLEDDSGGFNGYDSLFSTNYLLQLERK